MCEHEPELIGILSQRNLFRGPLARAFGYGEDAGGEFRGRERLISGPKTKSRSAGCSQVATCVLVCERDIRGAP